MYSISERLRVRFHALYVEDSDKSKNQVLLPSLAWSCLIFTLQPWRSSKAFWALNIFQLCNSFNKDKSLLTSTTLSLLYFQMFSRATVISSTGSDPITAGTCHATRTYSNHYHSLHLPLVRRKFHSVDFSKNLWKENGCFYDPYDIKHFKFRIKCHLSYISYIIRLRRYNR